MRKYVGLSLRFCLIDILEGEKNIEEISAVVATTAFRSIQECMDEFYPAYWKTYDKTKVYKTLVELWPLVCQPRMQMGLARHHGHPIHITWIDTSLR